MVAAKENRLSCTNKGPQMPSPSCIGSNLIDFIYDHVGVRRIKSAATPTIYPNEFYYRLRWRLGQPVQASSSSAQGAS